MNYFEEYEKTLEVKLEKLFRKNTERIMKHLDFRIEELKLNESFLWSKKSQSLFLIFLKTISAFFMKKTKLIAFLLRKIISFFLRKKAMKF